MVPVVDANNRPASLPQASSYAHELAYGNFQSKLSYNVFLGLDTRPRAYNGCCDRIGVPLPFTSTVSFLFDVAGVFSLVPPGYA